MARLLAVYPISEEDTSALTVRTLDRAIAFYREVLGFSLISQDGSTARLSRDGVQVGLVVQSDHDPKRAGSLAFEVDDLEALHGELQNSGGQPGQFGIDEWAGRSHRTFFLREAENGYCYCFYHPLPSS